MNLSFKNFYKFLFLGALAFALLSTFVVGIFSFRNSLYYFLGSLLGLLNLWSLYRSTLALSRKNNVKKVFQTSLGRIFLFALLIPIAGAFNPVNTMIVLGGFLGYKVVLTCFCLMNLLPRQFLPFSENRYQSSTRITQELNG